MLSENSNINLLAREQLRTDALAVVQGRLATLAGDDPVRENLLIAQEMLNNLVAPVFNARRITAMTPRGERNQTVNQALDYVTEMINRSDDVTYMRHLVGQMRQGFLAENGGLRRQINQRLQAAIDQRINRADLDLANETNLANLRGELLGGGEITRPQIQISIEDLALGR